ncbi:hypothetical protein [Ligilactobacillus animalis]|uniref:hypothetical protein n=1 Tax=Ligilactobacillus animalis TaxID=1605 RepID=UPI00384B0E6C
MKEQKIYYAFDPVTKEFAGEVMLKNKTENMTESPPVREFNGKTYHLDNPVWDGEKWVGKNKELDVLDAIKDLSIQVAQNTAVLESVTGGDHENV